MNLANTITLGRIFLAPVLLLLAWRGHGSWFLAGFILALVSDILDGQIARRLGLATPLGARLDSWADFLTMGVVPLAAWWLRPELFVAERAAVFTTLACYLLPIAVGFLKFRRLTSYHTTLARVSAYLIGASLVVVFARGPTLPFRIAVAVLVIAELEEIAITLALTAPRANVPSLQRALEFREGSAHAKEER
jgi:CDP-diacylglycerol--glycerol-3-phosphate 3-phosphatidyltransferase